MQLLYGLELLEKRGPLDLDALKLTLRDRLQHDVIDMEYVVLGVLQGALATNDRKMRSMFELLRPQGNVVSLAPAS